jgi:hypothetical protein
LTTDGTDFTDKIFHRRERSAAEPQPKDVKRRFAVAQKILAKLRDLDGLQYKENR